MTFFPLDLDKELQQWHRMVERSLEHLLHRRQSALFTRQVWEPPIDIYETEQSIVILAEIAGMKREDFHILVEDTMLVIRGYRESRAPGNRVGCAQLEIDYGTFARTIALPRHIDREHITVTYRDGFLEIVVPRSEQPRPRRIEIETE